MSDGEGMERIWAYLSPLISSLRYSTKTHRLVALDLRSSHHNDTGKTNSIRLLLDRGKQVEEAMKTALEKLKEIEDNFGHSTVYLANQWIRQRECQLSAMETESERDMMRQVEELVELEDQLRDTHNTIVSLRAKRRRDRTSEEQRQLHGLPDTVVSLEEQIDQVISELGSEAFRGLPGASDAETKALIRLKVSKSKLYKAKVGVLEVQKRWDQRGSGTRMQARFKKLMSSKVKLLKSKWTSYCNRATIYNENYMPEIDIGTPTFEEIKSMGLDDHFWDMGSLLHPNEPWAIDPNVREGIDALLTSTHCKDELRRISREARQAVKWAIDRSNSLENLYDLLDPVCLLLTSQKSQSSFDDMERQLL
ncbi:uncharacterized protein PGTG_22539 [Puccinia graminis f. sp. tritici CRL 75-36-700-3]|uniref:Uncharacterized protein n=1 Tax=Puccinia graminis f. sp. tritici (strain CRL 75-36-700-3 / race SCCL) TaxID=418459 RepID=H6QUW8_PUCGT|nr:uncharacterized protein PGTG_22539 [Puccinia graminis f. sp. tritici CRL 75-36-700-3]EHS64876.1 hypothetical protein PGTG_22539 [Puccinia graminis f. sp. tritici CRL 75-36-700-3]